MVEPIRVLHVDDDSDFLALTTEFLEREYDRFEIDTATSATEGLERLSEHDIDCIVSDYDMPDVDGIAFLEAVRLEYPDLPFILFTGAGSEDVASEAISAGATDYLQKQRGTGQYTVLANRIDNAVDQYRTRRHTQLHHQQYQDLFERAPIMYMATRDEGDEPILEYCNQRFADRLGYDRDDILGRSVWDFYTEDSAVKAREGGYDRARKSEFHREERRLVTRSGDVIETLVQATPRHDEAGTVIGVLALYVDVTEQREREQELRQLTEEYETVLATAQDAIFLVDVEPTGSDIEFRFRRLNPTHEAISGLITEEIRGKTPLEVFDEDLATRVEANYRRCFEERETITYEETLSMPARTIDWHTKLSPVIVDGEVTQIVGIARDITDRKERHRERQKQARRLQAIIENTSESIYIKGTDGRYRFVNKSDAELFGLDREEMVGKHDEDLFDAESAAKIRAVDEQIIESGESVSEEVTRFIDGEKYVFLENKYPYRDDDGDIIGIVGISRDITERKEYEQRLERQNERLEEFANIVGHDLRNPLNVAQGWIDIIHEECESDHLDHVVRAHERMEVLIEDLLTLALDGKTAIEIDSVDLADVVERCWQNVETADASLVIDTDRTIRADQSRLQQLFENLVRNAVEHGGENVTITVGDCDDGFYVTDDGPGIASEQRERVFESGYSTSDEGTGFGLAIVKQITESHGWEIGIAESSDGGVRFEILGVDTA